MSSCNSQTSLICPLCLTTETTLYLDVAGARYFHCSHCKLIFLDPRNRLQAREEKARYETHQNDPRDVEYRKFLSRLMEPLLKVLPEKGRGLDYGSGPGPTLSVMLEEKGYEMNIYDPFFVSSPDALQSSYDFITCTETVEHFFEPNQNFKLFETLLKPGGWLGVMTEVFAEQDFKTWYYRNDPTHVSFYTEKTFAWVSEHFGWRLHHPCRNVFLFQKKI